MIDFMINTSWTIALLWLAFILYSACIAEKSPIEGRETLIGGLLLGTAAFVFVTLISWIWS